MRNFSRGPVLGITGCQSVQTIPLPQWYRWRDGAFANWDQRMAQHYFKATSVPWTEKQSKAVFRGVLRPSCLQFDEQRGLHFVNITSKNWRTASRTKLWHLGTQHPDLFDVGIVHERSNQHQAILLGAMGAQPAERLAMEDQSMKFKYVVYIEGACGWADRLKNLLAAGMLIFMQKTPCQEFFAPLLRPMVHYVPVRNDLGDLVEKIRWVQENDNEAREIAANAADFAATWLTQAAWMAYAEAVFRIYAGLPKAYKTVRQPGAVLFKKPTNCPQRNDHYCDTSKSFGALSKP